MSFLIGRKLEMAQLFESNGNVLPVTIIDIKGVVVVGFRTLEKDGYSAVSIGYGKKKKPNHSETIKYNELGFVPRMVSEFRTDKLDDFKVGEDIDLDIFDESRVNISGVSKGKGFAGVVKRYGFHGGPKTHGQSDKHRSTGSIGSGTTPGRVFKGKKMPGRMGGDKLTIKNLKVVRIDKENKLIVIKGCVPGVKGGYIEITKLDK